jgi:hypothetical protein
MYVEFLDALDRLDPLASPPGGPEDLERARAAGRAMLKSDPGPERPKAALVLAGCIVGLVKANRLRLKPFEDARLDAVGNLSPSVLNRIIYRPWQGVAHADLPDVPLTPEVAVAHGQALLDAAGAAWCSKVREAYEGEGWKVDFWPPCLRAPLP